MNEIIISKGENIPYDIEELYKFHQFIGIDMNI